MENSQRMVNCPTCKNLTPFVSENPFRPFCSERCRILDLGKWADEGYRVPGDEAPVASVSDEDVVNKNQNDNEDYESAPPVHLLN